MLKSLFHQGSNKQILLNGEKTHETHFKTVSILIMRNAGSVLFLVMAKKTVKLPLTSMGNQ